MARAAVFYLIPGDEVPAPRWPPDLDVVATVTEPDPAAKAGLAEALQAIASGQAEVLLVARLGVAAGSLGELVRLVEWLEARSASLVAIDLRLDTAQAEGRRSIRLLREIHRWGREPELPRRPPGRPGLEAVAPDVAHRISRLRESGLSLHGIAAALNADGIPTPRGGLCWRASSVQSALGYRRPRPPAPGAPPPGPAGGAPPPGRPPRPRKPGPPGRGSRPGPGGRR